MDFSVKKKIRKNIRTTLKNVLPYGMAVKAFPDKPIHIGTPPELFNAQGERMLFAYLQDVHGAHSPYTFSAGRFPRRILWDRNNYMLHTQFYNHAEIFHRRKRLEGQKQFGMLTESQNVVPFDYERLLKHPEVVKELDALFTYDERLLDKYENACFSLAGGPWFGTTLQGGVMDPEAYKKKTKLLSIVSSTKIIRPLAKLRYDTAIEIHKRNLGDVMGKCVGKWVSMSDVYTEHMYSIAIENTHNKYYFTEKLLNNFAAMSVPVYYGATEIAKFFNPDGIITIKQPTVECVIETIKQCSREDYESRKEAIIDNYNRVQNFLCIEDYLTANYMDKFVF